MNSSDWRPTASPEAIRLRAKLYHQIRDFFQQRDVLEVDTAILSSAATTDPNIESLQLAEPPLFLQTSPEFAMKRLLANGSGAIYQIAKAFRAGEEGQRHHREFAMLEWYRPGFDYQQLMEEVAALLQFVTNWQLIEKVSYREIFQQHLGINPHLVENAELTALVHLHTNYQSVDDDKDVLLDLLMSHVIEPQLGQSGLTFIYDYPTSQCALAKITYDKTGQLVAQRFELYIRGVELAKGYQELTDWQEQEARFARDNLKRRGRGLPEHPMDRQLIAALKQGLPECAGVALGVDRLLMLMLGSQHIKEVL